MGIASFVINNRFGYPHITGVPVLSAPANKQLRMHSVGCVNGSLGSSCDIAIGYTLGAGNSAIYTASGGTASPYVQGNSYLANSGDQLYIQSINLLPDMISFQNSSLATGSSTYTYEYWNGSSWTVITPQAAPDFTKSKTALIIGAPLDWAQGAGGVSGLPNLAYFLRITVGTAPATGPIASSIKVCKIIIYREAVEAKQALEVNFEEHQFLMEQGQQIIPYFSIADIHNSVELGYRINP